MNTITTIVFPRANINEFSKMSLTPSAGYCVISFQLFYEPKSEPNIQMITSDIHKYNGYLVLDFAFIEQIVIINHIMTFVMDLVHGLTQQPANLFKITC